MDGVASGSQAWSREESFVYSSGYRGEISEYGYFLNRKNSLNNYA
jgi:hypothetical protein